MSNKLMRSTTALFFTMAIISMMFNVKLFTDLESIKSSYQNISINSVFKNLNFGTKVDQAELKCLTENIYYEAGSESYAGKIAVANVTMNRLNSGRYPKTICGVVYEGSNNPRNIACQFSWTCDGSASRPKNPVTWSQSQSIAKMILSNDKKVADITDGAEFFHAHYVKPDWSRIYTRVATIDNHLFYRR